MFDRWDDIVNDIKLILASINGIDMKEFIWEQHLLLL